MIVGNGVSIAPKTVDIEGKDIIFFDYDGTPVEAYTFSEALVLSALPAPPTHNELTFRGWTETLTYIKSEATAKRKVLVGAMYQLSSNETRFYITLNQFETVNTSTISIPIYFTVSSGSITVDWGDGVTQNISSSSYHYYAPTTFPENYVIKISYDGNGTLVWGTSSHSVFGESAYLKTVLTKAEMGIGRCYKNAFVNYQMLEHVVLPPSTSIGDYALYQCTSLKTLIIPDTYTQYGISIIGECRSLKCLISPTSANTAIGGTNLTLVETDIIPSSVSSYGSISNCYNLRNLVLPPAVTDNTLSAFQYSQISYMVIPCSTNSNAFSNSRKLSSLKLLSSVSSIDGTAFSTVPITFVDLTDFTSSDTVPTLSSQAFQNNLATFFAFRDQQTLENFANDSSWNRFAMYFYVVGD